MRYRPYSRKNEGDLVSSTREALLSEALRRFSGPRIGPSEQVDDLVSCWGKRGAYRSLLEPT